MSINGRLRNKRFRFTENHDARFTIETQSGIKLSLKLVNCSLTGLGAEIEKKEIKEGDLPLCEEILPYSKIAFDEMEFTLGRLVLRNIIEKEATYFLGLSTIDSKVPIDSKLSSYLTRLSESETDPHVLELNSDKFSLADFAQCDYPNVDLFDRARKFRVAPRSWWRLEI